MDNGCGFCGFRPKMLQRLATPRMFMVVYGFLGMVQAMSFIYFTVSLTTMERRFKIPGKTTGIMLSGNELSQIMLALFLSYFGGQRNRPKWIAWGVALCSLSCFILALPHFVYGPGEEALALTEEYASHAETNLTTIFGQKLSTKVAKLCIPNRPDEDCTNQITLGDESWLPIILVFISQFVLGIGNTLYFSLGNTYMDDNTKKTNTPMMLGYACAIRTLGPVFGFLLGPLCLSVFIEPSLTPLVSKDDARWFGAWWLGWVILGFLMLICALLVGLFPKHLPKKEKCSELPQYPKPISLTPDKSADALPLARPEQSNLNSEKATLRELPTALRRLLVNKLLMGNLVSTTFYLLGSSVYITYLSKYIEVQYHRSAVRSTSVLGPVVLLGMVAGFLSSGWYISKRQPKPRILLFWNVVVGILYVCGQTSFIFSSCPITEVETQLLQSRSLLITECNKDCSCDGVKYDPVCHRPTNQLYFSACHAGCSDRLPESQAFANCTCLVAPRTDTLLTFPGSNITKGIDDWNMVHAGSCSHNCYYGYLMFGIVSTIINIVGSSGRIGNVLVNYRCVEEQDKSFAQGLMLLVLSLFALIPGPIMYGFIMDATCLEWAGSCSTTTNCVLYDRDMFRVYVNVTAILFTSVGLLFDVFVWYYGKDLDLYGDRSEAAKIPRRERDSSYN